MVFAYDSASCSLLLLISCRDRSLSPDSIWGDGSWERVGGLAQVRRLAIPLQMTANYAKKQYLDDDMSSNHVDHNML